MKKRTQLIVRTMIFVSLMSFWALIAWAGGYNFDHRTPDVAVGLLMATVISGYASTIVLLFGESK